MLRPFTPCATQTITASTTDTATALAGAVGSTIRVLNLGSSPVWVAFGASTVKANLGDNAASVRVPPNFAEWFTVGAVSYVALKADSGTPTVDITRGEGA